MKIDPRNRVSLPLLTLALIAAGLALPRAALPQTIELAPAPMATSTTTTVKPNLMFVLDDSGSMAWDYMPDIAKQFNGVEYGFHTAQCNGVYYDPDITYLPPLKADGTELNATPTTFGAAYKDGFNTGAGVTNLNTGFTGGSGSGESGIALTPGPAFYFTYTGTQTTAALKNYFDTNSTFYKECNSDIGSAPGNAVFTKFRLAAIPTTTITVTGVGGGGGATIKVTYSGNSSNRGRVTSVKVDMASGTDPEILNAQTSRTTDNATMAGYIASGINACTAAAVGQCTTGISGYSAVASGNTVTITGPAAAAGRPLLISFSNGTADLTAFPPNQSTDVTAITVGGVPLIATAATGADANTLASSIRSRINTISAVSGYSAAVSNNIVTITGPASASNLTPVITKSGSGSPLLNLATEAFPESTPAKLQNFANWYSYYSNRMLMMKTGAGRAFSTVTDKYRVGFMTMNNNVSPGIVEANTFNATQKTAWYTKLYASRPNNGTPLREALSKVGQYYAHKFGNVTTYRATITVGSTGATSVDSITVNGTEIMEDSTAVTTNTSTLAATIANQINAKVSTSYAAEATGNVVTITGPASASGFTPVVDSDGGGMTFLRTAFAGTTVTNQLNGITPADPVEYSCQQNFTILSTDGYWTGDAAIDNLEGGTIGNEDGRTSVRPYNDGATPSTVWTNTYTRSSYTRASSGESSGCGTGLRQTKTQPEIGTCTTATAGGSCTPTNWQADGPATVANPCIASGAAPSPSAAVLVDSVQNDPSGGYANTLADVALYYYQTDIRSPALGNCTGAGGRDVCENNVFTTETDKNTQQHMTTFTLGLGARGRMVYSASYLKDTSGDYNSVKLGLKADSSKTPAVCSWQANGTVCNWPAPGNGKPENIDDLWHAAINGRGAFFSATDPVSLADGLRNALTSIRSKVGAAAAAATSTLNPTAGNNQAFVASYVTLLWQGNLEGRGINTDTGGVNENATWCVENVTAQACASPGTVVAETAGDTTSYYCKTPVSVVCSGGELRGTDCYVPVAVSCTGTMNTRITAGTGDGDNRIIKTPKADGTNTLVEFDATTYLPSVGGAASGSPFGVDKIALLSQAPPAAAAGAPLINYLRGRWNNEFERDNAVEYFRNRKAVLGDALESQPAYMGPPVFAYPYPGYAEFKAAQASRPGTVYMGTNDGMMHAFNSANGQERWAFVPSMVVPNLYRLADRQYTDSHINYVNGSPITSDVCTANCANTYNASTPSTNPVWKTILVSGLNAGGRGYFALDITDPTAPSLLWEFTPTGSNYIGKTKDADLGYTFGQAVITRKADGTWVVLVTSGYDNGTDSATKVAGTFVANSPVGSGGGFLYVLNAGTGAIISKIATGAGTAAAPSGLAKIAGFNAETSGNRASYIYGGDLLGNLWRFDINSSATAAIGTGSVMKLARLHSGTTGTDSNAQPIMTTPTLGVIKNKRVVFIGTGKYLEVADLATTQRQTQYAIKDDDETATLANPRNTLVQQFLVNNPDGTATRLAAATATATTPGNNPVDFSTGRGWFVDLPETRERAHLDGQLVLGTLLVPTIVPSATECSPGGFSWLNAFNYETGGAVTESGVVSSKYDSPIVGVNILYIEGVPVVSIVTADSPTPKPAPEVPFDLTPPGFQAKRSLWRELIPD